MARQCSMTDHFSILVTFGAICQFCVRRNACIGTPQRSAHRFEVLRRDVRLPARSAILFD